jgi:putative hydrolase of the HAD superfamily
MRAILVPHSDIPTSQQVAHDATPDAVAHELLDVLDITLRWHGRR